MEIKQITFWRMYNALKDAESVLWSCDGATNPEDEDLADSITELCDEVSNLLHDLQPVIKTIKEEE